MNKKITPRIIKIIVSQALIFAIAVTAIGAAATVHDEFKATADKKEDTSEAQNNDAPATDDKTSSNQNDITEKTSEINEENSDYPYAYAGFSPKTIEVGDDVTKILVNRDRQLPDGYKPTLSEAVAGSGIMLDYRVAPYYKAMYDAALADGIKLTPVSGYRSFERQKNNLENRIKQYMSNGMDKKEATAEAVKLIMLPGASEHNAGLAMDICSLSESFENTDEFDWLSKHAAEYGFILRYPKAADKREITHVEYEPWHYRYVGVDAAQEITRKGITLEEYLGAV